MKRLPLLLFALLAMEMGLTFQLSVGSLVLGLLLVAAARRDGISFSRGDLVAFLALVGLMLFSCFGYPGLESWDLQALRVGFQCVLVGVSALAIRGLRPGPEDDPDAVGRRTRRIAFLVAGVILAFSLAQLATIVATGGNTLRIPVEWFAADRSDFIQDPRRPSAFYSEPSYAAFILASLACINTVVCRSIPLAILLLATTVVCQSASGLIALVLIQAPLFIARWSPRGLALGALLCGALAATLALLPENELRLLDRAASVSSDESLTTRLANPWIAIDRVWRHDPLGVQQKSIADYSVANHLPMLDAEYVVGSGQQITVTRPAFIDNGMLNLLIYHGVLGLPIILLLVYCLQARTYAHLSYLLIIGQFNGDWLSPDKIGALTLVMAVTAQAGPPPPDGGPPIPDRCGATR